MHIVSIVPDAVLVEEHLRCKFGSQFWWSSFEVICFFSVLFTSMFLVFSLFRLVSSIPLATHHHHAIIVIVHPPSAFIPDMLWQVVSEWSVWPLILPQFSGHSCVLPLFSLMPHLVCCHWLALLLVSPCFCHFTVCLLLSIVLTLTVILCLHPLCH